jgi:pSer/pThr/pTyr-binding forkhead associated (FHA) protein/S1-C subfamily serine protease
MPRIVLKDLATEKAQSVPETDTMIGRDPACGFVIEGPNSKVVSGRHARIFYQDSSWWIEDTSRNGTVLDDERLQAGQRHAIKIGQVIGLGESGPRLRIMALDSRQVAETVMEFPDLDAPAPSTTAPRRTEPVSSEVAEGAAPAPAAEQRAARARQAETIRAKVKIEEPTEPMSPSPDWLVHVVLRATNTNQRYDVKAMVVKLGRSAESNVQIPAEQGASVSRNHAEIAIQDGGVVIRDVGSRNGTFVNGKRLEAPQPAAKSDQIMLGSGGPTFAIEDLHIVKGQGPSPGGGGGVDTTPAEARPGAGTDRPMEEPKTDPSPKARGIVAKAIGPAARLARRSFAGVGRTAFFKDVLEDMSEKSARRVRIVVWASVGSTVLVAALLLAITQWRVTASENRLMEERRLFEARADSIRVAATADVTRLRTAFDSARASSAPRIVVDSLREALADAARRTGVLEQALARARQSLDQQLATGDSARHRAEVEIDRLRAEVGQAQSVGASRVALDSLRRVLREAEGRAAEVSSHIRAVRGVDLAQVAQLNQNAVGLVTMFADTSGTEGSGFAITPSGYFVTNRHVVTTDSGKLADSVFVTMADQRYVSWSRADVVAIGQGDVDIAVLKIRDYRGPYIKRVDWSTVNAKQGEPAALIGFPRGTVVALDSSDIVRTSMSAGIFSKITPNRIQADLFSQGGSSGSPIFNASGEVVAVHFAGLNGVTGLGFAVPVSRVVFLLPSDAKSELGLR